MWGYIFIERARGYAMVKARAEGTKPDGQATLASYVRKGAAKEVLSIVADHRENGTPFVEELLRLGVELEFRVLKVGDYVISDDVAVERKTLNDFVSSIIDRRLFEQAKAMKDAYARPLLLIENEEAMGRGISKEAMRGALLSVILDIGVPALICKDAKDAAETLVAVAKRVQRGPPNGLSIKDRRKPQTPDGEREYVVASLPFVEATLAKRMLGMFRTVEGVFTASEEELQQIDKIGPKKARRIRELVAGEYGKPAAPDGDNSSGNVKTDH